MGRKGGKYFHTVYQIYVRNSIKSVEMAVTSLFLELLIEIVFLVRFYLDALIGERGINSLRKPALGIH